MPLKRLLSRFTALIGWPGGVGAAMLGAALILSVTSLLPVRDENASLQGDISQMQALLRQPQSHSVSDTHQQLDAFMASLSSHEDLNSSLNLLHELAARHGLSLKNSEYRPAKNRTGRIQQLRITVKTEGEYAKLRSFLQKISETLPTLAIRQLSLSRRTISDVQLETAIEFTLFYSQRKEVPD